jgi:hypothetical protein
MDDYLAAGFTEAEVTEYQAQSRADFLSQPGVELPVQLTEEQMQFGEEVGAPMLTEAETSFRDRVQDSIFNAMSATEEPQGPVGQAVRSMLQGITGSELIEPSDLRFWSNYLTDVVDIMAPGVGGAISLDEGARIAQQGYQTGNAVDMVIGGALVGLGALELVPIVKGLTGPARRALSENLSPEAKNLIADMIGTTRAISQGDKDMLMEILQPAGTPRSLGAAAPDPETAGAITAFHGSPYDFDAFDIRKMGTGEGAQAYGPGLYFAESENVAREYRDTLSRNMQSFDDPPRFKAFDDQEARFISPSDAQAIVNQGETAIRRRIERIERDVADLRAQSENEPEVSEIIDGMILSYDGELQELNTLLREGSDNNRPPKGRLYEVNIRANPEDFLNWDAPISQQSEKVRETLMPFVEQRIAQMGEAGNRFTPEQWMDRLRGGDVMLLDKVGDTPVSRALADAGVPGVRYLDQGSRATAEGQVLGIEQTPNGWIAKIRVDNRTGVGFQSPTTMITTSKPFPTEQEATNWANAKTSGGTRNIVVFDDQLIDIVRKYGVAGLAIGAAVQSELGVNEQIEENT